MAKPVFTLEWNDPDDAEQVAAVLQSAAHLLGGSIDRGFMDDADSLYAQVAAHREQEEENDDA